MWPVGCEQTWYLQHWGHLPQTLFLLSPIWWLGSDNCEIKGLGEVQAGLFPGSVWKRKERKFCCLEAT